jgi:predicted RNA-binding protein with PUA-like domain
MAKSKPSSKSDRRSNSKASSTTRYWLMKSEPNCYSIDDLKRDKTTHWDGVRNYQARNFMRDDMKKNDKVLFYHSNAKPPGIAGVATIHKESYPDFTAFDPNEMHFDPKSKQAEPTWYMVDVKFSKKLKRFLPLEELRTVKGLDGMVLLQKGSRLSVQPVTKKQFETILKHAEK